jgi:hypothetical protein
MSSTHVLARWLARVAQPSNIRTRRRTISLSAVPAEMLESRMLLSATGGAAAVFPSNSNGHAHQGMQMAFQTQPADTMAGQTLTITVAIEDSSGNPITGNSSVVRLRVHSHGNSVSNNRYTALAVNGVATFNVVLTKVGTYWLQANAEHLGQIRSNSFAVTPDTTDPEHLVFSRHNPHQGHVGAALKTITVAVEDEFGNLVTSDNSSVSLGINSGPTLSFDPSVPSPDTVTVQNGIAQFTGVILDTAGTYTLSATDSVATTATAISGSLVIK